MNKNALSNASQTLIMEVRIKIFIFYQDFLQRRQERKYVVSGYVNVIQKRIT